MRLGDLFLLCSRAKFRGSPKALVTKVIKETFLLAWLMTQGKVISLKILVIEMGDRGSKSIITILLTFNLVNIVKEQRVDGSSTFKVVRYTLVAGKPVLRRNKVI